MNISYDNEKETMTEHITEGTVTNKYKTDKLRLL